MKDHNKKKRQRTIDRNLTVQKRFEDLQAKHPQWRYDALLDVLAKEFFLAPATINHILNGHYDRYFYPINDSKNGNNTE